MLKEIHSSTHWWDWIQVCLTFSFFNLYNSIGKPSNPSALPMLICFIVVEWLNTPSALYQIDWLIAINKTTIKDFKGWFNQLIPVDGTHFGSGCYIAGFRSLRFFIQKHTRGWRRVAFNWMLAWRLLLRQWTKCVFVQEAPHRASGWECKKLIHINKIPFFSQS